MVIDSGGVAMLLTFRRVVLMVCVGLCLVALYAGWVSARASAASLGGPLVVGGPWLGEVSGESMAAAEEVQRVNPEAFVARQRSRSAYMHMDTASAAELDHRAFSRMVDERAGGLPRLPADEHVGRFLSTSAAQLELPGGKHVLLESSGPLARNMASGRDVPLDLTLGRAGAFYTPTASDIEVEIPRQLSAGVRAPTSGVSLTPVDARGEGLRGSEGRADGASVLYANTQTDSDTLIKPTLSGFDVNTILRSAESPRQLYFRVGLPAGAKLARDTAANSIRIVSGGKPIGVIPDPTATDVQGASVPLAMSIAGEVIILSVEDGAADFPVAVDPEVFLLESDSQLVETSGGERSNWKFQTSSEAKFGHEPDEGPSKDEGPGRGYLETTGIAEYKEAEYASWAYQTKGVSKIYELNAKTEGKNKGAEIESFLELEGNKTSEDKEQLSTELKNPEYGLESAPPLCAKKEVKVECAPTAGAAGNVARFQQSIQKKPSNYKFSDSIHEAIVYLAEPEGTHSSTKFNTTSPEVEGEVEVEKEGKKEKIKQKRPNVFYTSANIWLSNHEGAFESIATDPGIGVSATKLEYESAPAKWEVVGEHNYLNENDCYGVQCYTEHKEYWTLNPKLPNGEDKIRYRAEEAMSGSESPESESIRTVKVDTSPPHNIGLQGLPYGNELSERAYSLTAVATDGEGATPSSGVASIKVYVDNDEIKDTEKIETEKGKGGKEEGEREGECSVPKGECTASARYMLNGWELGAGHHSIVIVTKDKAGNEARHEEQIAVRHSTPVALGPGSVDLESGDFALSSTDVSLGSGLTVSRAYSSRDLTAGSEGPLGPQWTIATANSESLLELVDYSVVLTAANGSQTIFAAILNSEKKPTGKFEAPPGDSNLELTLEENEKKEKVAYYLKNAADHTKVKFALPSGGGKTWVPTRQEGAVATDTVIYTYQTVEVEGKKITEPTEVLAPVPVGVECPPGKLQPGCRALKFLYSEGTSAKGENKSEWGGYDGRLSEILYEGYDPETGKMTSKVVAEYLYDKKGRLRAEWDPRIQPALETTYGYDAEGHVTALTPPGLESWVFTYGTIPDDTSAGRLIKAAQAPASAGLWDGELPTNTEAPKIAEGTPHEGVAISVVHGTWTKNPIAYSFQWEDCSEVEEFEKKVVKCTPIAGATDSSYIPTLADVGYKLAVKVGALNGGGLATVTTSATPGEVQKGTEPYKMPTGSGSPHSIAKGPNGDWYTEYNKDKIGNLNNILGTFTEFTIGGTAEDIVEGPEGDMWFTEEEASRIGKITTSGTVTEYSLPGGSEPVSIAIGPDKNLWFTEQGTDKIGRMTTSGEVTQFSLPAENRPHAITAGSDGNIWFTLRHSIDKMTTSGTIIGEYKVPVEYPEPWTIITGPEGDLWFTTTCDEPCDAWKMTTFRQNDRLYYASSRLGRFAYGGP